MSKVFLLCGGVDTKEIYLQIKKTITKNSTVAVITTASRKEKQPLMSVMKQKFIFTGMGAKQVDFFDVEIDLKEKLLQYDHIHFVGGNPFYLMYHLQKNGYKEIFNKILNSNKNISGVSAGAMVLGTNMGCLMALSPEMNTVNLKDYGGLGACPINICPHFHHFVNIYDNCDLKLKKFEKDNKIMLSRIDDGTALIYDTNTKKTTIVRGKICM